MTNLRLSDDDWMKLRDFNQKIAFSVRKQLPADWYLDKEEVEGAVYDTFIYLLNNYKPGAISPTSYCYQYAEQITLKRLLSEYQQVKNSTPIDVDEDDDVCKHEYGKCEVKSLSIDTRKQDEDRELVKQILDKMPDDDKMIANMVMEGKSLREIGEELGISHQAITKRLKKYKIKL